MSAFRFPGGYEPEAMTALRIDLRVALLGFLSCAAHHPEIKSWAEAHLRDYADDMREYLEQMLPCDATAAISLERLNELFPRQQKEAA